MFVVTEIQLLRPQAIGPGRSEGPEPESPGPVEGNLLRRGLCAPAAGHGFDPLGLVADRFVVLGEGQVHDAVVAGVEMSVLILNGRAVDAKLLGVHRAPLRLPSDHLPLSDPPQAKKPSTANFSVVDPYRMMRTKGFAEGLTLRAYSTDRACMACAGQYQRNLL